MYNLSFDILEKNLVDLNNAEIPEKVMQIFWEIKKEKGSRAMGVSHISGKGWYILCPSEMDNPILKHFSEED